MYVQQEIIEVKIVIIIEMLLAPYLMQVSLIGLVAQSPVNLLFLLHFLFLCIRC